MAESFSVRAMLSAKDSGFTSTLKSCSNALDRIDSKISGFSFGMLTGAGQAAFSALSNGVRDLVGEIDSSNAAWKTFDSNLKMLGWDGSKISGAKKDLQEFAQQTVYSSSDMSSTFAQLAAVGVKDTAKLVKGFGGLAAAAENPQQAMKTLSQQATQMAAKPEVAWADFKLMLEQTPAGMAAVAKAMGMTTSELVTAVQDGEVATKDFLATIAKVGTNDEFTKLATEAKTVGQAMDGLKETVGNKLLPVWEMLTQKGIGAIDSISSKLASINVETITNKVSAAVDAVGNYWNGLKESFSGVGTALMDAFNAVKSSFEELTGAFGSTESVDSFKGLMQGVANFIKGVAGFVEKHADSIAKLIQHLPKIILAIKGFKICSTVAPFVTTFAKGIAGLAAKGLGGVASKLFGIGKGVETVGETTASTSGGMLESAKAFALMGVAVLLIAAGFALLTQSAIALANAGPLAIGVMAGLVIALAALGIGMMFMLKTLAPMSAQMVPIGAAMLMMGAAVLLVAVGFALLAQSAIALANAGPLALVVMAGLLLAVAGLALGAAALGAALTAGAVGFIAFGAALLLCGVAAVLAAAAIVIIATALPTLAAYGLQGALAIAALGAAMMVFAIGAGLAGVAAVVLGAGLAVVAIGLALVGAAVLICAAGVLLLAAGALLLGTALLVCGAAVTLLAGTLPLAATGALLAVGAFAALMGLALILGPALLLASGGFAALALAAAATTIAIAAFAIGMTAGAGGTLVMAGALKAVKSQMKSIASSAKTAQKSLTSMRKSVKVVESGLDAMGSKAKSAMKKLTSAFDDTASKAKSAGKKVGNGFTEGMQSGLAKAPAVAMTASAAVGVALNAGRGNAYSAGAYISIGFAQGMLSQLGVIRSAANQMAAAADKAVRAKAKIHSPSKVSNSLGAYWGEGFANGISDMANKVWNAAENLVAIPTVATPNLASFGGEMAAEYDYYRNAEYVISVPLTIDGKEFARTTATYTQNELDKRQTRESRKHGRA